MFMVISRRPGHPVCGGSPGGMVGPSGHLAPVLGSQVGPPPYTLHTLQYLRTLHSPPYTSTAPHTGLGAGAAGGMVGPIGELGEQHVKTEWDRCPRQLSPCVTTDRESSQLQGLHHILPRHLPYATSSPVHLLVGLLGWLHPIGTSELETGLVSWWLEGVNNPEFPVGETMGSRGPLDGLDSMGLLVAWIPCISRCLGFHGPLGCLDPMDL